MKLSIIIFCFNEAGTLKQLVHDTKNVLKHIATQSEIIIVNDGSTDDTKIIGDTLSVEHSDVIIIHHQQNKGIGMALQTGYAAANLDFICAVPGDGQFDVRELLQISPFDDSRYYSFYRIKTGYSVYRKTLTWLNRLFNQHILSIYLRDVNWIKVYRKTQLQMVNPQLTSSLIESEICAKLYKSNILPIEIPSQYLSRTYGTSNGGSWKTLKKAITDLSRLWLEVIKYPKRH